MRPAATALNERDPERTVESDLLERIELLEDFEDRRAPRSVRHGAAQAVLKGRDQLLRIAKGIPKPARQGAGGADRHEAFLQAVFVAFADRLALRRGAGAGSADKALGRGRRVHVGGASRRDEAKARLVGGRGVRLGRECRVRADELFVCVDVDAGANEGLVRQASAVAPAWLEALDPGGFDEHFSCEYDEDKDLVRVQRHRSWRGLVLSRVSVSERTPEITAAMEQCLTRAVQRAPERAFDLSGDDLGQLVARYSCLALWKPELGWEALDAREWAVAHAEQLVVGKRSFAECRKLNLAAEFANRLDYRDKQRLDSDAPARFAMPNKSTRALLYELGRPPILAARIALFFGWKDTPRIAGGRVPLLLHLCAPNGRAQQVTDDLAGFWAGSYALVRKDLRGRYPKQPWPEDPAAADPVPQRRRR